MTTQREYFSARQAAEHLGVTERTLRNWIADGLVTAYRVGPKVIRIARDDLSRLIERVPAGRIS